MAYFDSPKNRAIWEKELASLRRERERRASEGYTPDEEGALNKAEENPLRKRVTLEELERQESEQRNLHVRRVFRPAREKHLSMDSPHAQQAAPVKETPSQKTLFKGEKGGPAL